MSEVIRFKKDVLNTIFKDGLKPGTVNIISGQANAGKTRLLIDILVNMILPDTVSMNPIKFYASDETPFGIFNKIGNALGIHPIEQNSSVDLSVNRIKETIEFLNEHSPTLVRKLIIHNCRPGSETLPKFTEEDVLLIDGERLTDAELKELNLSVNNLNLYVILTQPMSSFVPSDVDNKILYVYNYSSNIVKATLVKYEDDIIKIV